MAKVPFRFMRGELLNGFYIRNFLLSENTAVQYLLDELAYQALFQWKLEGEITSGEVAIRPEDLVNFAKFSGIFKPIQYRQNTLGSIRMTESEIVNGAERSERGLFNMDREKIEFVRTEQDNYPTDIVNESTDRKRQTLIPDGRTPVGYVKLGTDLYEPDGTIIWANVLSAPPTDGSPYTEFYGENFLTFEETFSGLSEMSTEMFMDYYSSLKRIDYNGPSVYEFLYLTKLFCDTYVYDVEIVAQDNYYNVYYSLNLDSTIDNRSGRFSAWVLTAGQKFKLFVLTERV